MGKSIEALAMVDSARSTGLDIKLDQYPFNVSYTSISILIPSAHGPGEMMLSRIA
ncbi:hypothetical protein [Fulvivirga sp. M361]|uniref:hypothetical protein n=1 Tax=Fulvivirga sp. M361 TaxID=2594266 RepID=UPI0016232439|nr:hypothetical protein [Fulvivirga sp. M361]